MDEEETMADGSESSKLVFWLLTTLGGIVTAAVGAALGLLHRRDGELQMQLVALRVTREDDLRDLNTARNEGLQRLTSVEERLTGVGKQIESLDGFLRAELGAMERLRVSEMREVRRRLSDVEALSGQRRRETEESGT